MKQGGHVEAAPALAQDHQLLPCVIVMRKTGRQKEMKGNQTPNVNKVRKINKDPKDDKIEQVEKKADATVPICPLQKLDSDPPGNGHANGQPSLTETMILLPPSVISTSQPGQQPVLICTSQDYMMEVFDKLILPSLQCGQTNTSGDVIRRCLYRKFYYDIVMQHLINLKTLKLLKNLFR